MARSSAPSPSGVGQRPRQRERGVGVHAGPIGVGGLGQPLDEAGLDDVGEGTEIGRPLRCLAITGLGPLRQLGGQLQRPAPPVRPLVPAIDLEVRGLCAQVRLGQVCIDDSARAGHPAGVRHGADQSHQRPVHLDRRVPVETAVEGRMRLARSRPIVGVAHHVPWRVRVLLPHCLDDRGCESIRNHSQHRHDPQRRRGT
jgi:hypothetical protein